MLEREAHVTARVARCCRRLRRLRVTVTQSSSVFCRPWLLLWLETCACLLAGTQSTLKYGFVVCVRIVVRKLNVY